MCKQLQMWASCCSPGLLHCVVGQGIDLSVGANACLHLQSGPFSAHPPLQAGPFCA